MQAAISRYHTPMFSFFFFALGTIIASFVGVIVVRIHTGQGFVGGRSSCDVCGTQLSSLALVPVISYFVGGGRARCCGARISWYSPLTEILLGSLFVLSYLKLGLSSDLMLLLTALSLMLALVLYDLAHQILPTTLLTLFTMISAVTGFLLSPTSSEFVSTFFVAILLALILFAMHFFSRGRAMGFADAPFVFGLALLVGPVAFSGFVFSFWIGAVIGILILLRRPAGTRMGVEVPFAPFLAAGFILAYFTQWTPLTIIASLSHTILTVLGFL